MKNYSAGFIGGGRITRIFLHAFQQADQVFSDVSVFDTDPAVMADLKKQFSFVCEADQISQVADHNLVFIALHPPVIKETLTQERRYFSKETIMISLAPKITIKKLQDMSGMKKVIRVIPNATSYIQEGYNPVCFSDEFEAQEKEDLLILLNTLGKTFEVRESLLEGYAIVSAMLPTYFWFQWQQIEDLGLQMCFSAEESHETVKETLMASWRLFYESGLKPDEVMDLIPVKPIGEHEDSIRQFYEEKLLALYQKIKS